MISNLELAYQSQQEDYFYSTEEAPGSIYRQSEPWAGYGPGRRDHLRTDKHGKVIGARTAKEVSKMMIFRKLDRGQVTADTGDVREYLEGVEFYDNGNEKVAVARYRNGKGRFIDVYDNATQSTETIEVDLTRRGFPRNTIDWESPKARRRDDITGWG